MFSLLRSSAVEITSVAKRVRVCNSVCPSMRLFATDRRSKQRNDDKPGRQRANSARERDRESDRKGGDRESSANLQNLLDKMDSGVQNPTQGSGQGRGNGKLSKPLEKVEKALLSPAARGQLDAFSEDILDVLNEALESNLLLDTFKGSKKSSKVVEFIDVKLNKDCSHVTAHWSSDILNGFTKVIAQKQKEEKDQERIHKHGDINETKFESSGLDAEVLYERGVKYINR